MSEKPIETVDQKRRRDAEDSFVSSRFEDETDRDTVRERILSFIREKTASTDADGVVVPMSGGLDSTVTGALAVEALGAADVYGLVLPCNKFGAANARDAEALAEALGIDYDVVHLQPLFTEFSAIVPGRLEFHGDPVAMSNLVARLRMSMAYLAANTTNRLVLGTTNRSERLLGYFTKHGDGGADLLPIGHLYKTEVRVLAEELNVPEFVLKKRPTAEILPGHSDEDDLGASYELIDDVLALAVEEDIDNATIANRLGLREEAVRDLIARYEATDHKRNRPPTPVT